jgi:hypothetical protein
VTSYRMVAAIALLLSVVLTLPPAGYGQAGTGFPAFGSFQSGDFDSINLQNLNVSLTIPIVNHPGRGQGFQYGLAYNSLIFTKLSGSSTSWGFSDGWTFDRGAYVFSLHQCRKRRAILSLIPPEPRTPFVSRPSPSITAVWKMFCRGMQQMRAAIL